MKYLIYIITFLCVFITCASSPYITDSGNAIIEVIYKRKQITDTTSRESRYSVDDVMLRIGVNLSLFCGVNKFWEDSISAVNYPLYSTMLKAAYEKDKKNFFFLGGKYWSYIYKDKQKNQFSEFDYFNLTHWKYEEPLHLPIWNITDKTKKCAGYECLMATTQYKGRKWFAWFTPEIPISDGPWKLCGLPGLILEAHDEKNDYEFTTIAIHTTGIGKVGYMWYIPQNKYQTVSRDKFFKEWRKFNIQDGAAKIKSTYGINSSSPQNISILTYDREETDYPHE